MNKNAAKTVINELMTVANSKTIEESYNDPRGCISFQDKVRLMDRYYFLRDFERLKDLDNSLDIMRKVLLMGRKGAQAEANEWLKTNDEVLEIHQKLRTQLHSAEIIESIFGKNLKLDDPDMTDIFTKCRTENRSEEIKPSLLKFVSDRKKRKYDEETDAALEHLRSMQSAYSEFISVFEKEIETMDEKDFNQKYNFTKLLNW